MKGFILVISENRAMADERCLIFRWMELNLLWAVCSVCVLGWRFSDGLETGKGGTGVEMKVQKQQEWSFRDRSCWVVFRD